MLLTLRSGAATRGASGSGGKLTINPLRRELAVPRYPAGRPKRSRRFNFGSRLWLRAIKRANLEICAGCKIKCNRDFNPPIYSAIEVSNGRRDLCPSRRHNRGRREYSENTLGYGEAGSPAYWVHLKTGAGSLGKCRKKAGFRGWVPKIGPLFWETFRCPGSYLSTTAGKNAGQEAFGHV
jgi:hypothetical protein